LIIFIEKGIGQKTQRGSVYDLFEKNNSVPTLIPIKALNVEPEVDFFKIRMKENRNSPGIYLFELKPTRLT